MTYRLRVHPKVADDLLWIARMLTEYSGTDVARAKLSEIETTLIGLRTAPHRGSIRDDIAPGLRAIPAGRKGVIIFSVDDTAGEVLVHAVSYGGADWVRRSRARTP